MNTTYFKNLVMGNVFNSKTNPAIPSKYYLGISSTEPTQSGTNVNEPSGSGSNYSRVAIASFSAPNNGAVTNATNLEFPESYTSWGLFPYYVIFDAATGGNLLMYGKLSPERTIEENTVLTVSSGALELRLLNPS